MSPDSCPAGTAAPRPVSRGRLVVVLVGAGALALAAGRADASANVLWSAGHETGDISEWLLNGGGPEVTDSGVATSQPGIAHSGRYALRLSITGADGTAGGQAIRMFRWRLVDGSLLPTAAYYSVWVYFPVRATPRTFWNVIQWKTKLTSGRVVPVFVLNVGNRPRSGDMYFYLYEARKGRGIASAAVDLPVRRWVQIETYYRWSTVGGGRVTVFQDGRRIIDRVGLRTQFATRDINARQWSVNNYTDDIRPSTLSLLVDDAAITRRRLGPAGR